MSNRDLINKPIPLLLPESEDSSRKNLRPQTMGKLGVRERAREVAAEAAAQALKGGPQPAEAPLARERPSLKGRAAPKESTETKAPRPMAFEAAYFNRDVEATSTVNQRARPMAALRGEEGATDLKKVVLPQSDHASLPGPEEIGHTLALMLGQENDPVGFDALLGRMGRELSGGGLTMEKLKARLAEFEALVAARKEALLRMTRLTPEHLGRSITLARAFLYQTGSQQGEEDEDFEAEGESMVQEVSRQAGGLHRRLSKMMRSKV